MPHLQVRADDYALSEETKRLRDAEQRAITDAAYRDALGLVERYRPYLDRLAQALLAHETLERPEIDRLLEGLEPESNSSLDVGVELPGARGQRPRPPGGSLATRPEGGGGGGARRRPAEAGATAGRLGDLLGRALDGRRSPRRPCMSAISCSLAAICDWRSAIRAAPDASSPERSASAPSR